MQVTFAPAPLFCPPILRSRSLQLSVLLGGVLILAALAQIKVVLPFTPVPITGQTFGVTLLSLVLGRRLAVGTVGVYLATGVIGLPVFAGLSAFTGLGPTSGYLAGMLASAWIIGGRADRGATSSLSGALLAAACGSLSVYAFGVAGLLAFVPSKFVIASGILPFLPGDVLKSTLACLCARGIAQGGAKL